MYLQTLENFFDYKPVFDENPQFLIDEIIKKASSYLPQEKLSYIQKAYDFALEAHKWTKRLSWEPYIVHPIRATQFLMKINPWIPSIEACLLHDIIEDTKYEYKDIKKEFGEEVAELCEWMVKVSKVKYIKEDRQIETLKKTFLAMSKDLRVIFIKFADRIHNIQTLNFHPNPEKRERIAEETLKIYVPIAQRLWLNIFQSYLENWSFRILNPKEFNRIVNFTKKFYWHGEWHIKKWVNMLYDLLSKEKSVKFFDIKGRLKSPYRIFKKMIKYQTNDLNKIMDILAYRILTDNIADCYNILGILHSEYTPIIKKIKDYISIPKPNGYRSLHTTILWMFNFPVEIQIRTKDMDEIAEYWVAAHFSYKEVWDSIPLSEKQAIWIKKLQDLVKDFQNEPNKEKFKDNLQVEFLDKNIFVYTPKWEIRELPAGSTVLDFAFRIHSDIWLSFKSALINWIIVPIDYKLKTWDIVKIQNFKNKFIAAKSWMDYLHTPSAKAKLNKYIKQAEKEKLIKESINILNSKLKEFELPLLYSKEDKISKKYKWESLENLLTRINDKQINITRFLKEIYGEEFIEQKLLTSKIHISKDIPKENLTNIILIDWDKKLEYTLCPECNPKIWDKIIWKSSKEWIKIHSLSCKALTNISLEKLIKAHWLWYEEYVYILKLTIALTNKPWYLLKILSIFSDLNINIKSINVNENEKTENQDNPNEEFSNIEIELYFSNPSKIQFVLKELKNNENYVKIIDKKIY